MSSLGKQILRTIRHNQLLFPRETVLLGVSGGPDSVTLLYLLHELRQELGIQLQMVHVNHQLRKTAHRDEAFVRRLAQKLGLKFTAVKVKIKKTKSSLEELAREARLKAFFQIAQKNKIHVIALGHTRDDLAETVLMRIVRGTVLNGLQSILPKRNFGSYRLIRPLLETSRSSIEQYLRAQKIPYRIDHTNKQKKFFRNKVRAELLPLLQSRYNPQIKDVLAHLAQSSSLDYDFLYHEGQRHFCRLAVQNKKQKTIRLKLTSFLKLHPSLQRMVLRIAVENLKGSTNRLTLAHMENIETLLSQTKNGTTHLPASVSLEVKAPYLSIHL